MKNIHTFESFLQEVSTKSLLNENKINFKFIDKGTIDKSVFSKFMPKTAKTSDEATESMKSREGEKVNVEYTYHKVTPKGNKADQPTYTIEQSEYQNINVSRLSIFDTSGPREKHLGTAYVSTDTFLSEMKDLWKMLPKTYESLESINEASTGPKISAIWNKYKSSGMDMNFGKELQAYYDDEELEEETVNAIDSLGKAKDLVDFSTVNGGDEQFGKLLDDIKKSGLRYAQYVIDHGGPCVVVENK
jgi:hypothetical protein